jgi:hypothetical protein
MVAAGCVYSLLMVTFGKILFSFIVSAVIFIGLFPLFRKYIFTGRYMETIFRRETGAVEITRAGITGRKRESFPVGDIRDLKVRSEKTGIENPDGVAFVERISAQHGMSIPGFGEETTFYILEIIRLDGSERIIFVDTTRDDVISVQRVIKEFLGLQI